MTDSLDLEAMARTLEASGAYQVLRRFTPRTAYAPPPDASVRLTRGLIVDVETTGLEPATDAIIEFGAVPFDFDREGRVYRVHPALSFFEDPGRPLTPEIVALTGITDAMVAGQRIDEAAVTSAVQEAALVIAHNAFFDRRFLERRLPAFIAKPWACSQQEVPWTHFGCRGTKLDYLLYKGCREFHTGHRATDDCLATLHVLVTPRTDDQWPLALLLANARKPTYRLWANAAPFESKEQLKARQYKWFSGTGARARAWYRDLTDAEALAREQHWLQETVYPSTRSQATVDEFTAKDRYSERMTL